MSYIVVYEYNKKNGGLSGYRFPIAYKSEMEFRNDVDRQALTNTIAAGISKYERDDLLALIPDICLITKVIEDLCPASNGVADLFVFEREMNAAITQITRNRLHFANRGYPKKTPFKTPSIDRERTEKNELLRWANKMVINDYGDADLTSLDMDIPFEIVHILAFRKRNRK